MIAVGQSWTPLPVKDDASWSLTSACFLFNRGVLGIVLGLEEAESGLMRAHGIIGPPFVDPKTLSTLTQQCVTRRRALGAGGWQPGEIQESPTKKFIWGPDCYSSKYYCVAAFLAFQQQEVQSTSLS
jgi:hypothetical protein